MERKTDEIHYFRFQTLETGVQNLDKTLKTMENFQMMNTNSKNLKFKLLSVKLLSLVHQKEQWQLSLNHSQKHMAGEVPMYEL